ncbi:MAG TPA: L-glutamate gamma-semialdehyde dehydrogenase [Candidatus Saccharimonadaceae bacterium]|jgi:1-pyrroline-5-carboxylate dehydrogenase|nr:L-glutamate gamma-semialdehyde dehydrogenase [Candidatus Saccharimonadaceae bacterium]
MNPATARPLAPIDARALPEYAPTTYIDFSRADTKAAFERALEAVRARLGEEHPLVIDGKPEKGSGTFASTNPARPSQVVGRFQSGTREQAIKAVEAADRAFKTWSRVPAAERAAYLVEAARRMKERRHEFSAWMVLEVGKSWAEADADTAEAIDFMEFYAREMLRYDGVHPVTPMPGEKGGLTYVPLGVGAIIPPWNFPLAICVGMTTAAIVAGNTVVVKPSSDSPAIAWQFYQLMEEVGLPPGVFNFVTGSGGTVGDSLVRHPRTRFISFTGSKEVGVGINKLAADVPAGQIWLKRVVAEMGGKDSIIVDEEADLDAAAQGVAVSAFGFGGQKCSACSRAIVSEKVYEPFLAKLKVEVEKFTVGPPDVPGVYMGPVINAAARDKILSYIEAGKKDGRLVSGGGPVAGQEGWFVQPTVIADVPANSRISQEEIFGPVLAVLKVASFDEALDIANGTEYGLTGAVYTKNPAKVERARREFFVGNLYINRKCTGAIVGAHPFGGFNMSGTDSKAGGRDYLLLFLQAKSIAEKV